MAERDDQDESARPELLLRQVPGAEEHQPRDPEKKVTAFIGPSGCGKSTLLRVFNRMFELYPEQRAEGEVNVDGENILTSKEDVALVTRQDRHGVPEADAVSDVDLRQHRFRREAVRESVEGRHGRPCRVGAAQGALWNEVKDKLGQSGYQPVGRAAAAAVHRARDRRASPRSSCSTNRARRSIRSRPRRSKS